MKLYSGFVALCLLGTAIADEMVCPENCVYKKCVDPCPRTCETLYEEPTCNRKKCSPGCQCMDGFVLSGDDCISLEECSALQCGFNAVYSETPCSTTCANMFTNAPCTPSGAPGCQCLDGYFMNTEGECVPAMECSVAEALQCGFNAVYSETPCSTTCANMFTNAPCTPSGAPGCQCLDGYFMNTEGECVPAMECSVAEVICPLHSSFSTCASSCPKDCKNMIVEPECDRMCNIRCDCNPGYVYNERQQCILPETCDPTEVECPFDRVFHKCRIHKTCQDMYEPVNKPCVPDCFCADGKVWDFETESCIPMGECSSSVENKACRNLDENMQYYSSHPIEVPTCRNPDPLPSGNNKSGCFCKPGYVWNKKHICVALKDCCVCDDLD